MKTILVPFDFSESAKNSLQYAIDMALDLKASLALLIVNNYPVLGPEVGVTAFSYVDAKEDCYKELEKVAETIRKENPTIAVTCYSEMGEVAEEVDKICITSGAELVVMGVSGHSNGLMQNLAGSSAVMVAKHIKKMVMIVPHDYKYKTPKRVAFACKYGEDAAHPEMVEKVKQFCQNFDADLHMVHIVPEGQPLKHTEVLIDNYQEHRMEESSHRTFIITEKKVADGLLGMLKNDLLDLLIIEPKKHNFFTNLFHSSTTTELAFNSPVPILAVH